MPECRQRSARWIFGKVAPVDRVDRREFLDRRAIHIHLSTFSKDDPAVSPVPRAATSLTFRAFAHVLYSEVEGSAGLF